MRTRGFALGPALVTTLSIGAADRQTQVSPEPTPGAVGIISSRPSMLQHGGLAQLTAHDAIIADNLRKQVVEFIVNLIGEDRSPWTVKAWEQVAELNHATPLAALIILAAEIPVDLRINPLLAFTQASLQYLESRYGWLIQLHPYRSSIPWSYWLQIAGQPQAARDDQGYEDFSPMPPDQLPPDQPAP